MRKDTTVSGTRATLPAKRGTNGGGAGLGIHGKNSSGLAVPTLDAATILRKRYALLATAAQLMPGEAVARCSRRLAPFVGAVNVIYSPGFQKAHYSGLERCHSVWMCPVCSAKISERRRVELASGLKAVRVRGGRVLMCTYTFRHNRGMKLVDILRRLFASGTGPNKGAWKRYKSGRRVHQLYVDFGVFGTIRAIEVTFSLENGWHVHIHELCMVPDGIDKVAFEARARELWRVAAAKSGLDMDEHGFDLEDCDQRIAEYIAKYGREPRWQEDSEMTKYHVKQGRPARMGQTEHMTPMQMLAYAAAGDDQAAALWQEYARCFKGLQQLVWSDGLKKLLGLQEKTDQEVNEEETEDGVVLASLVHEEWRCVLGNDARADLLLVAASGDVQLVAAFLYALGLERFGTACQTVLAT